MKLSFHGGLRSVTGKPPSPGMPGSKILLDCGLFQGSGRKPTDKIGFLGSIHERSMPSCSRMPISITPARCPCSGSTSFGGCPHDPGHGRSATVMLEDSARLQENDCAYLNRKENRRGKRCLQPFYESTMHARSSAALSGHATATRLRSRPASPPLSMMWATFLDPQPFA